MQIYEVAATNDLNLWNFWRITQELCDLQKWQTTFVKGNLKITAFKKIEFSSSKTNEIDWKMASNIFSLQLPGQSILINHLHFTGLATVWVVTQPEPNVFSTFVQC